MLSALPLATVRLSKLVNPLVNHLFRQEFKYLFDYHLFFQAFNYNFIVYTYFEHIPSSTVIDDAMN